DAELESITNQLNELLETEEARRKNVEELRPAIKEMAEMLNENKNIYDRGKLRFEIEIEELTDGLNTYDDLVENVDYHQAKDVDDKINEKLKRIQKELEEYPELYQKCKVDLPNELNELSKYIHEMKVNGYPVDHFEFEEKIRAHQTELITSVR